ncbi:hypothetical protein [Nocardia asiatica]|uniref:hypothetical protein n=1 Tax=Nocardia asiatica TaxID=209252 RepID=UPI00030485D6|nr:hypothetical protein [Nocardia asiatica]
MAQSLRVDQERLRALVPEFEDIGADAQRVLNELKAAIEREGDCWGDDPAGKAFERTYLPDAEKGVASLTKTVESLREEGKIVAGLVDDFDQQDLDGVRRIKAADPSAQESPNPDLTMPLHAIPPSSQSPITMSATPESAPPTAGPDAAPSSDSRRASSPSNGTDIPSDSAPLSSPARSAQPSQPNAPANQLPNSSPGLGDPFGAFPPERGNSDDSRFPPPATAPVNTRSTGPAATPARADATGDPATNRKKASTPWSRGSSGTAPSSNTPAPKAASPQISAPPSTPPRVAAPTPNVSPRMPSPQFPDQQAARPAAKVAGKAFGAESKSGARHPWAVDGMAADDPVRIARELAQRHDLQLVGFDDPGVDGYAIRELAAAIDDVLTQYPYLDLRQIAIMESRDAATRLEWDWVAGRAGPEPYTRRIVLDTVLARNPGAFAEFVRTATESGNLARSSDRRPVYSTMVRELGHALDVAGGFRARESAHDTLIAEFTRTRGTGTRELPAASSTSDYEQWRAQLSGYAFHNGRFDPGMALADAFTEVQLNGPEAGPPAKVLHRLLVETARKTWTALP